MKLTLFKRNTPRGFNYKPRYYDPVKEAREERRRELLGPDAQAPGGGYVPGDVIRTRGIRRDRTGISSRAASRKRPSTMRAVIALAILGALLVWWFTSK